MLRLAPEGEAPRIGGPDEIQYYGLEEFAHHYAMNDFDPGEIQCERIGRRCSNVHDGDTVVPQYRSRPRNEPFMGIEGSMDGGYDFFGRAGLATVNNSEREIDGAIDRDGVIEQLELAMEECESTEAESAYQAAMDICRSAESAVAPPPLPNLLVDKTYATPASALLPLPPIPEESSPLELHRTIRIRLCGIRGQQASSTSWRPGRR